MSDFPIDLHSAQSISIGSSYESVIATALTGYTPAGGGISTNRVWYYPFRLDRSVRVRKLWVLNGTTISGNLDMGIYDYALRRLVSMGSTPQAGANTCQILDVADTDLGPGLYYLAIVADNNTGQYMQATGPELGLGRILGVAIQASTFPLPATAVPVTILNTVTVMIGMVTGRVL